MLQPIQIGHELICPCGCACVIGTVNDIQEEPRSLPSVDLLVLGSALEKNMKYSFPKSSQQVYEERVLKQLSQITKEFALPETLAVETFNQLRKKRRGFQSESRPIKQLLQILSKDDYYPFMHKKRAIEQKYKEILSGG